MQFSHAGPFVTPLDNFDITRINTTAHHITISYTKDTRNPKPTGVFADQPHCIQ
jgi:hypothetical protein